MASHSLSFTLLVWASASSGVGLRVRMVGQALHREFLAGAPGTNKLLAAGFVRVKHAQFLRLGLHALQFGECHVLGG